MDRLARIIVVTLGLVGAGAGFGAAAAVLGLGAVTAVLSLVGGRGDNLFFREAFVVAAETGAALGAVLGPAAGWLVLRSVPLGRAVAWTTLGTAVGAAAGSPLPHGALLGAATGFGGACLWLRHRARVASTTASAHAA